MNQRVFWNIALILFFLTAGAYFFGWEKPAKRTAEVIIGSSSFKVEVADTYASRARGLSGRAALAADRGMLFLFEKAANHGFWMKDMKFAIDIIWIKGDRIAGFKENALPEPEKSVSELTVYYPPEPVDKVLEINSGLVEKYGFQIGEAVMIE
jgi:hypothetical protein